MSHRKEKTGIIRMSLTMRADVRRGEENPEVQAEVDLYRKMARLQQLRKGALTNWVIDACLAKLRMEQQGKSVSIGYATNADRPTAGNDGNIVAHEAEQASIGKPQETGHDNEQESDEMVRTIMQMRNLMG